MAAFRVCASLTEAAAAVKIDRGQHYDWLRKDAKYAAAFDAAKVEAAQSLEDEAVSRARRGVYEPNVYQGRFIYPQEEYVIEEAQPAREAVFGVDAQPAVPAVTAWRDVPGAPPLGTWKKSDGLMMFLLRGFLPQKYRQNGALEISGPQGGPIPLEEKRLQKLTDDELAALIATAGKLAAADGDDRGTEAPGPK